MPRSVSIQRGSVGDRKLHERHQQRGGIECGRTRVLDETGARRVPEALVDVAVDGVTRLVPAGEGSRKRPSIREADGPVDRHPAHHPRVEELPAPTSDFPDALVRFSPVRAHPVDQPDQVHPRVVPDRRSILVIQVDRVHQLAVDVELEMGVSGIADAHGT